LGWVPAMRLMPPATRQPAARNFMMIVAHIIWGATLGSAVKALSPKANLTLPSEHLRSGSRTISYR
jgi:uncharacterized membrane protein YagU involved in acid resistance